MGGTGVAALPCVGAKVGAAVVAVALGAAVTVAAGLAVEVVAATLEEAVAEAVAVELGVIAGDVVFAADLLSEPPQATSASAPMPITTVASVFNRESPGGVCVRGRRGL